MKYMCHIFLALFAASASFAETVDLSTLKASYEAQDGDVLKGELNVDEHPVKITIANDAKVTLRDVTIKGIGSTLYGWAGLTCLGNCTIVLEGLNTVTGFYAWCPGIQAAKNGGEGEEYTLTIEGEGSLVASSNGDAAGIGSGNEEGCGNIIVNGGKITAEGGFGSAGIGGGYGQNCGNITINGGEVVATGGEGAAGIGACFGGDVGNITISGGKVTATGASGAAGIGGGYHGESCGDITISGGEVAATSAEYGAGIGGGYYGGYCGNISISGGTVTAISAHEGAGIGSGYNGFNGDISISGGKVTATSAEYGAGIGSGDYGICGDITINGGEVAAVGGFGSAGIGSGYYGISKDIKITDDVTKVVAIKGEYTSYSIGAGSSGNAGDVIIGADNAPVEKGFFVFPAPSAKLVDIEVVAGKTYAVIDGDYSGDAALKIAKDVKVDKVIFDRPFPEIDGENNYATIMFPFEINAEDVGNVWQGFSFAGIGVDAENRKFVAVKEVDKFEAYKPYLIQLFPDVTKIFVNNAEPLVLKKTPTKQSAFDVAQSSEYNKYGDYVFRGVVQGKTWGAEDDDVLGTDGAAAYGFASAATKDVEVGQFVKVGEGASIKPFRGYIYKNPVPKKVKSNGGDFVHQTASIDDLPDVMDIVVVDRKKDGSEQTTVIGQFNSRTGEIRMNRTKRTYDLKGRSVRDASRMAKGVYLKK